MRIYTDISLENFEAWSGAVSTLERIKAEGKCDELESILEDLYPDGMDETELNDLLWFEDEQVFEWLGIRTEDKINEELEEAKEDLQKILDDFLKDCENMDMDEHEADEYWEENYKDDAEELELLIETLEGELEDY